LYFQMSKRQQCHERIAFKAKPALRDKIVPTKEQLDLWKNSKIYGIFIEGKRVKNSVLTQHANTDFYFVHLYTLEKESLLKNNYKVEVILFTKRQFDGDRKAVLAMRNKTPYKYDLVYQTYSKTALAEIDAKKE
jgi:bla regulator protein blaR1